MSSVQELSWNTSSSSQASYTDCSLMSQSSRNGSIEKECLMTKSTTGEALCCCEYENEVGERSHILGCLCDCEALDQAFDRLITCRPIPLSMSSRMWRTIADRCRLPGITGSGARKVDLEVAIPLVSVPLALCLGSLNEYFTAIVLVALPLSMLLFYRSWRIRKQRARTKIFFVWALTSILFTTILYLYFVVSLREVLLWENLLLISGLAVMFVALFNARQGPAIVRSTDTQYKNIQDGSIESQYSMPDEYSKAVTENPINNFLMTNMGFQKDSFKSNYEAQTAPTMDEADVTWVDSRPIKNGQLKTWCEKCRLVKPPRVGHCSVCEACVVNRDHHCVWIDACVGGQNHRSFLVALLLFIFCGLYGSHLTLTSVCTPTMIHDWFLLPKNCQFVYGDFGTAICFVSACYAILGCSMMSLALVVQLILISQNVTSHELHQGALRGFTTCGFFVKNNIHNQGFLRNWIDFIRLSVRRTSPKIAI